MELEQKCDRTSMVVQHHRWRSLPDDIIINIVSRLDLLRDTVITISTTNFSIEQHDKKRIDNIYEYWNILDNLFILFAPPIIDTFCLDLYVYHIDEPRCWPIIDTPACQLRSRNVQHMTLLRRPGSGHFNNRVYPPSVFQIRSLVTLALQFRPYGSIDWRLPNSIVVPNLKKLYLSKIDYANLVRLLSCCPSLEELSMSLYDNTLELVVFITSKSLKRLSINLFGESIRDVIIETPILEQLDYYSNSLLSMHMLKSMSNVKSVILRTGSSMRFINCLTTLPELNRLDLCSSSEIYQAIFDQQMMHCPNLEVLVLSLFNNFEIILNEEAMFMLVQPVKHIELRVNVDRVGKYALVLVTWLLRSAPVLKKLVISGYVTRVSDDSLSKFRKNLIKCAEDTSRYCQIEFLGEIISENEKFTDKFL